MTEIKIRRDTAENWSSNNPVLAEGELAYSTTNKMLKVGDGSSSFNSLDWLEAGSHPSGNSVTLSLPANEGSLTAPALGWFACGCIGTAGSSYMEMVGPSGGGVCASFNGGWGRAMLPVASGTQVTFYYGGTNFSCTQLIFIYARASAKAL